MKNDILKNRKYYTDQLNSKFIENDPELSKLVLKIKNSGLQVLRNHKGEHCISIPYIFKEVNNNDKMVEA